jgi:hypothetical protein
MTPAKAIKAGTALMMWMPADNVAWVARCQAVMERLKAKEVIVKAGASAQEGAGIRDAAQEPERVKTALGAARLDEPRSGLPELGSTKGTPEAIEAGKAETSTRDVGQEGVKEMKEVVETPQDAGKEEEQLEVQMEREEPQPQQQQQHR